MLIIFNNCIKLPRNKELYKAKEVYNTCSRSKVVYLGSWQGTAQSISYENRELREEVAKGYCLIKKIEELEGLERKLSEENKQLQQKLTLADEDIEKHQKELAKCSSVHESENKCWHEKVNKLEQELRVVRANLQTTTKRYTELNQQVIVLKIKLEDEEKQKEELLLKQK